MQGIRIFRGWRVVAGAGIGVGFGSAVFLSVAFPLIVVAISAAYGWTQTEVARGASLALLLQAIGYPAVGFLIDRFGSRAVAGLSILLFAVALAGLAASAGVYGGYLFACAMIGLLAAGTNMVGYTRAITYWFDARRGLALGVAAGFQALGAATLPVATQKLIAGAGWTTAVVVLAAFEALVCLPVVWWLVEDDPAARGLRAEGASAVAAADVSPPAAQGALFAKLAVSFAIMGFTFYAIVANVGFILSASGLGAKEIAVVQAVSGLSLLIGRIGFGRLLDRWPAAAVTLLTLAAAAAFCFGLAFAKTPFIAAAASAFGGLSIGGESDLLPYLAGRYWGRERVSRILGLFLIAFVLGAALGPVALAHASAALGGPRIALMALGALQIVPALLFLGLPAYPARRERAA